MNNPENFSLKILGKLPHSILFLGLWGLFPHCQGVNAQPIEPKLLLTQAEELENDEPSIDRENPDFGQKGSKRWYIQGAGATTVDNDDEVRRFLLGGAGISKFFANGHSINLELNGMSFFQTGDDAIGLNLAVLLRWHFYRRENWSVFVDGGAGVLGTTNNVPTRGSSFNFTPQLGGGTTIRLADDKRLILGIRWHHISNADLYQPNPGRDSVMGYVGLNLPR